MGEYIADWAAPVSTTDSISERDTYHNHKFTGLSRIGHMDGAHSFLKVLVCVLILAPTVQAQRVVSEPPFPEKRPLHLRVRGET